MSCMSSEIDNYQVGVTKERNVKPSAASLATGRHAKLATDGLKAVADFIDL